MVLLQLIPYTTYAPRTLSWRALTKHTQLLQHRLRAKGQYTSGSLLSSVTRFSASLLLSNLFSISPPLNNFHEYNIPRYPHDNTYCPPYPECVALYPLDYLAYVYHLYLVALNFTTELRVATAHRNIVDSRFTLVPYLFKQSDNFHTHMVQHKFNTTRFSFVTQFLKFFKEFLVAHFHKFFHRLFSLAIKPFYKLFMVSKIKYTQVTLFFHMVLDGTFFLRTRTHTFCGTTHFHTPHFLTSICVSYRNKQPLKLFHFASLSSQRSNSSELKLPKIHSQQLVPLHSDVAHSVSFSIFDRTRILGTTKPSNVSTPSNSLIASLVFLLGILSFMRHLLNGSTPVMSLVNKFVVLLRLTQARMAMSSKVIGPDSQPASINKRKILVVKPTPLSNSIHVVLKLYNFHSLSYFPKRHRTCACRILSSGKSSSSKTCQIFPQYILSWASHVLPAVGDTITTLPSAPSLSLLRRRHPKKTLSYPTQCRHFSSSIPRHQLRCRASQVYPSTPIAIQHSTPLPHLRQILQSYVYSFLLSLFARPLNQLASRQLFSSFKIVTGGGLSHSASASYSRGSIILRSLSSLSQSATWKCLKALYSLIRSKEPYSSKSIISTHSSPPSFSSSILSSINRVSLSIFTSHFNTPAMRTSRLKRFSIYQHMTLNRHYFFPAVRTFNYFKRIFRKSRLSAEQVHHSMFRVAQILFQGLHATSHLSPDVSINESSITLRDNSSPRHSTISLTSPLDMRIPISSPQLAPFSGSWNFSLDSISSFNITIRSSISSFFILTSLFKKPFSSYRIKSQVSPQNNNDDLEKLNADHAYTGLLTTLPRMFLLGRRRKNPQPAYHCLPCLPNIILFPDIPLTIFPC